MAGRIPLIVLAGLLFAGALIGGLAYVTDAGIEATVTEKGTDSTGRYVVATTDLGGFEVKRYLSMHEWLIVQRGNHVIHHINTGTTEIYSSEGGTLIWRG